MKRVGYVLKRYPRLSETFILQEILGLERLGVPLHIFAIMDPHEGLVHPEVQCVAAEVHYLHTSPLLDIAHILTSHIKLLGRAPRRYLGALKHVLDTRQPGRNGLFLALKHFWEAGYLAELANRFHIDHLHAHFAHNPTSLARFAQMLTGVTFSFTAHAKDIYTGDPARLVDKMRYSEFTVTCTGYNQRYLCSLLHEYQPVETAATVHLVYHGVDVKRFTPELSQAPAPAGGSDSKPPKLLSVGRLVSKKGHTYLIRALGLLKEKGCWFTCDIYGTGPLRFALEELVTELGLGDRVFLQGARTREELLHVYRDADIFVLAPFVQEDGDRDGLPNVLLEAMACELPVIATDISGIPELVQNDETGLLVEPRDAIGLASAIERTLADPDLRARLAKEGRRRVQQYFAAENNVRLLAALFGSPASEGALPFGSSPSNAGPVLSVGGEASVYK